MSGVGGASCLSKDAVIRLPFSIQKTQCPLENHKTSGVALPWKSSLKFTILNAKIVVMPFGIQFIRNDHLLLPLPLQPTVKALPVRCGVEMW